MINNLIMKPRIAYRVRLYGTVTEYIINYTEHHTDIPC